MAHEILRNSFNINCDKKGKKLLKGLLTHTLWYQCESNQNVRDSTGTLYMILLLKYCLILNHLLQHSIGT